MTFGERKTDEFRRKFQHTTPKRRDVGRPQVRSRDQHTLRDNGTNRNRPSIAYPWRWWWWWRRRWWDELHLQRAKKMWPLYSATLRSSGQEFLATDPEVPGSIPALPHFFFFSSKVRGLEQCPLSLVRTIEELLEWKSSGSGLGNRD
jgi:hypothetical protein